MLVIVPVAAAVSAVLCIPVAVSFPVPVPVPAAAPFPAAAPMPVFAADGWTPALKQRRVASSKIGPASSLVSQSPPARQGHIQRNH